MKYIIVLYITALMFFLIGLGFGMVEFLGIGHFVWALIAGIALAIYYLFLYFRSLDRFHSQMGEVKVHGFFSEVIPGAIVLAVTHALATIGLVAYIAIASFPDRLIPLAGGIIAAICLIIHIKGIRHKGFLAMHFSPKGAHLTSFSDNSIVIPWNECADIGIGWLRVRNAEPHIYFSKDLLTDTQVKNLLNFRFSNRFVRVKFTDEVLFDVSKYIDKNRIRNLHIIKQTHNK